MRLPIVSCGLVALIRDVAGVRQARDPRRERPRRLNATAISHSGPYASRRSVSASSSPPIVRKFSMRRLLSTGVGCSLAWRKDSSETGQARGTLGGSFTGTRANGAGEAKPPRGEVAVKRIMVSGEVAVKSAVKFEDPRERASGDRDRIMTRGGLDDSIVLASRVLRRVLHRGIGGSGRRRHAEVRCRSLHRAVKYGRCRFDAAI